jgi:hypothetical protein
VVVDTAIFFMVEFNQMNVCIVSQKIRPKFCHGNEVEGPSIEVNLGR